MPPLVRPSKPAYAAEVPLVEAELAHLGAAGLDALGAEHLEIIVCRGSITDHARDLRGKRPRGWPQGRTWDEVPGVYLPNRGQVVIALRQDGAGGWRVPPAGDGHGSFNLVLHETMHGFDYKAAGGRSRLQAFRDARAKDAAALGAYESQPDPAGSEETYAESAARHFGGDEGLAAAWKHLAQFWDGFDFPGDVDPTEAPHAHGGDGPIGFARQLPDAAIALDLRAEGEGGEIGHALITFAPGHPLHAAVSEHLFTGLEAAPGAPVVVQPFR